MGVLICLPTICYVTSANLHLYEVADTSLYTHCATIDLGVCSLELLMVEVWSVVDRGLWLILDGKILFVDNYILS